MFRRSRMSHSAWTIILGSACCLPLGGCGSSSADVKPTAVQEETKAAQDQATLDAFKGSQKNSKAKAKTNNRRTGAPRTTS